MTKANNLTARQMINTELAARAGNIRSKKVVERHVPAEHKAELLIHFNCECANPDCAARVPLTLKTYNDIHRDRSHFIIVKGHDEPKVEKILTKQGDVAIVEKFALK